MEKDLTEGRGITLNSLREEQYSLNMRLLLAVQLGDLEAQRELRVGLDEVAARIDRLLSRRL